MLIADALSKMRNVEKIIVDEQFKNEWKNLDLGGLLIDIKSA